MSFRVDEPARLYHEIDLSFQIAQAELVVFGVLPRWPRWISYDRPKLWNIENTLARYRHISSSIRPPRSVLSALEPLPFLSDDAAAPAAHPRLLKAADRVERGMLGEVAFGLEGVYEESLREWGSLMVLLVYPLRVRSSS